MRATEIAHDVFFRVPSFLVSNDNTAGRIDCGKSRRHCFVVGEQTVATKFGPAGETTLDVIQRERPLDVTRDLNALPGAKISVNLATGIAQLGFDRPDLGIEVDIVLV